METALSSLMHSHENINFQAYLKIHPFVISHDDILRIIGNSDECWNNSQGPNPRYRENKDIKGVKNSNHCFSLSLVSAVKICLSEAGLWWAIYPM